MANDTPTPRQIFTDLSVALTGFDRAELGATGLLDTYYDTLLRIIGEREAGHLLRDAGDALAQDRENHKNNNAALELKVIHAERYRPVVLSLIKLWYLGRWYPLPPAYRDKHGSTANDVEHVISAQAYREGLVWAAAGAHPMGAKAPGFGSWAQPPTGPRPSDREGAR
ncbi:hypothetical protein [Nocardia abscessus]|uniref:hypothetical protein n=1 Tax=Nocardia abscessus TaxID=120957 RepID=UPI0002E02289|nr:hypothetical protein [Nocardia abscessus]MCC3331828.1 hypothetical protein [Nocardia abscessus]